MRASPEGTHVMFTRIVFGRTGNFAGSSDRGRVDGERRPRYDVADARVVYPTGECKQWTPDGKGVIIQAGRYDAGNVDDIVVDLSGRTGDILFPGSTFRGTRVTAHIDLRRGHR